jgi:hypothetical protein
MDHSALGWHFNLPDGQCPHSRRQGESCGAQPMPKLIKMLKNVEIDLQIQNAIRRSATPATIGVAVFKHG